MMLVDCQTCPVRDHHCADCIVTALAQLPYPTTNAPPERRHLGVAGPESSDHSRDSRPTTSSPTGGPESVPLDRAERRAVSILAAVGLVDHEVANDVRAIVETGQRPVGRAVDKAHRRAM